MPLETEGFDAFMNDIGRMAQAMDANDKIGRAHV